MRKVILLAIVVVGLAGLLRPQIASAQTRSVYAVKFVCGRQGPPSTDIRLPAEPPVKPGNYATKINVENLSLISPTVGSATVVWKVSIADDGESGPASLVFVRQLQTMDITCVDIVKQAGALFPAGAVLPQFINGYVNIIPNAGVSLAVTGVYTSQGCFFNQSGDSQGPPICTGPVSIEVVPEQFLPIVLPTT